MSFPVMMTSAQCRSYAAKCKEALQDRSNSIQMIRALEAMAKNWSDVADSIDRLNRLVRYERPGTPAAELRVDGVQVRKKLHGGHAEPGVPPLATAVKGNKPRKAKVAPR